MSIQIPVIEGQIKVISMRACSSKIDLPIILTTIREVAGTPPYRLRERSSDERVVQYKNIAIYLSHYYQKLGAKYLASYFALDEPSVRLICENPYQYCNLAFLEPVQVALEARLIRRIPISVETGMLLTYTDLEDIAPRFLSSGESLHYVSVSKVGDCTEVY